jgi:hypothetical protein
MVPAPDAALAGAGATRDDRGVDTPYDSLPSTGDPVADLILRGEAATVDEAEELYLDRHLHEIVALVDSALTDAEFRRHPLVALLLSRGSRAWDDSLL